MHGQYRYAVLSCFSASPSATGHLFHQSCCYHDVAFVLVFSPSHQACCCPAVVFVLVFLPLCQSVGPVVQPRADFVTPNPYGGHLDPMDGVRRLLRAWDNYWSGVANPYVWSRNIADIRLIQRCLQGEPTILDPRSF